METTLCILCGNESAEWTEIPTLGGKDYDVPAYACPNCGRFVIGEIVEDNLKNDRDRAFRLACLVRERRVRGEKGFLGIFSDEFQPADNTVDKHLARWWRVSELLSEFPSATHVVDRALLNLTELVTHPMDRLPLLNDDLQFILFCPHRNLLTQLKFMQDMGFIEYEAVSRAQAEIAITPAGWRRTAELARPTGDSRQAFVAMWFDPNMRELYDEGIEPAIKEAQYEPRRIDLKEFNEKVDDEIIAEIRKSRFVVADVTGQRRGVYFEAGYGMGMGLPVIWLVRKDEVNKLHFDTRQYNHIVYESAEDLKQKLYNRIAATIH